MRKVDFKKEKAGELYKGLETDGNMDRLEGGVVSLWLALQRERGRCANFDVY